MAAKLIDQQRREHALTDAQAVLRTVETSMAWIVMRLDDAGEHEEAVRAAGFRERLSAMLARVTAMREDG